VEDKPDLVYFPTGHGENQSGKTLTASVGEGFLARKEPLKSFYPFTTGITILENYSNEPYPNYVISWSKSFKKGIF